MADKLKMSERMRRDYIAHEYLFPEWWIGEITDLETTLASEQEENRKLQEIQREALREALYKHQAGWFERRCSCGLSLRFDAPVDDVTKYAYHLHGVLSTPPAKHRDGVVEEVKTPSEET